MDKRCVIVSLGAAYFADFHADGLDENGRFTNRPYTDFRLNIAQPLIDTHYVWAVREPPMAAYRN